MFRVQTEKRQRFQFCYGNFSKVRGERERKIMINALKDIRGNNFDYGNDIENKVLKYSKMTVR